MRWSGGAGSDLWVAGEAAWQYISSKSNLLANPNPGGQEEVDALRELLSGLSPTYFVTSETRLTNRPTAPVLMMAWRISDATVAAHDLSRRRQPHRQRGTD